MESFEKMIKQPSPPAKCDIEKEAASDFLLGYYSNEISELKELDKGKHSRAFSYEQNGQGLVVRFNTENTGFVKDKFAYEHFNTEETPIPEILDTGIYQNGIYYCITKKVVGETGRDQYKREDFSSLPLQYATIESISRIKPPGKGFGYLDAYGNAPLNSSLEYMQSLYRTEVVFDWNKVFEIPFVERNFTDYVAERMEHFAQFGITEQELLHGDFGSDNIFIKDVKVSGIIDWEKTRYGDHFLDVGRVLLFCPDKKETTKAAIAFYSSKKIENWRERIAMGVYHIMLTNYAHAALGGNEVSCRNSRGRLEELEYGLGLTH
jgi:hygromycin-B 4-O-kinase